MAAVGGNDNEKHWSKQGTVSAICTQVIYNLFIDTLLDHFIKEKYGYSGKYGALVVLPTYSEKRRLLCAFLSYFPKF